ncbi:Hypothetical protein CHV_d0013 [Cardinium endosymbiont cBtQ1 of Bemisia tabaci]|nr:Hypothetical protein CHV_d0013 [Cardinium endosymbiont cBtQ1 of Bemisia tabaci]
MVFSQVKKCVKYENSICFKLAMLYKFAKRYCKRRLSLSVTFHLVSGFDEAKGGVNIVGLLGAKNHK